ncbi:helix-turn-helix domain-containing protein [Rathayibacter sp. ZW T2_19]|uniref:Helix-turn-helix domain-containing protein n=1 Tax=Rathayibacter rubneri TaxID=2950106 RepID=A0A9X2IRE0_9MICO|nr:helix-turn-helix domain-containing protein [Rathayibacter rubneri]MCM6761381.1 helix-turn-helix domain-containing protein [Rathayibacter rubneri]
MADLTPQMIARLEAAGTTRRDADAELRNAVLAALDASGSVRAIAAAAGISTNTVQRWKRGE